MDGAEDANPNVERRGTSFQVSSNPASPSAYRFGTTERTLNSKEGLQ